MTSNGSIISLETVIESSINRLVFCCYDCSSFSAVTLRIYSMRQFLAFKSTFCRATRTTIFRFSNSAEVSPSFAWPSTKLKSWPSSISFGLRNRSLKLKRTKGLVSSKVSFAISSVLYLSYGLTLSSVNIGLRACFII